MDNQHIYNIWQEYLLAMFDKVEGIDIHIPHFFAPSGYEAIKQISMQTSTIPGVWPECVYDLKSNFKSFVLYDPVNFHTWSFPANQNEIIKYCTGKRGSCGVSVFLNCKMPITILQEFDDIIYPANRDYSFDRRQDGLFMIQAIQSMIEKFEWGCINFDVEFSVEYLLLSPRWV